MTTERLNEIKLTIAKEYPNDYEMQKLTLDDQIDSYKKLEKLKDKNLNDTVFTNIVLSVVDTHPIWTARAL